MSKIDKFVFTNKRKLVEISLLFAIYIVGFLLNINHNIIASSIMIIGGISYYFYFSLLIEHSFIKFKAAFSGVWLCTIGLSILRLLEYQESWSFYTWIYITLAHVFFLIANDLAIKYFPVIEKKFDFRRINNSNLPFEYRERPQRLFWIATVTALIGIVSFLINVHIKGYIPFFEIATNPNAYVEFYTRFHIFVVASAVTGGFSYYIIKKYNISLIKRLLLILYIAILVFIIPILLVQRGTFINGALILITVIYLMSNRKFYVFFICIVIVFSVYLFGSNLRGYSDSQLNEIFKPKEIANNVNKNRTNERTELQNSDETNNMKNRIGADNSLNNENINLSNNQKTKIFKLSPQAAFLYSYLTVSHDNFNYVVENKEVNSWGILQLKPFNVIMRSDWIEKTINNTKTETIVPHLNTYNIITYAYLDFGAVGVIFFISLWSFCFGLVEIFNNKYKGIFSMLAYGICLLPVALCFFDPWMSNFTTWLLWGTIFLMFLASAFTYKKRRKIN